MTQPSNQVLPDGGGRYHALDAVRAFALLLGVVFHAAESFESNAINYWAVGDRSSSLVLEVFRHASHSFRLELFFVIAGFFAHLLWRKRGVKGFVANRVGRILVPLVVGWAVVFPALVFLWLTGAAKTGRWDTFGVPEEFRSVPPWQLTFGFFVSLGFIQNFDLTHLWFLHQLLTLYGLALAARWIVQRSGRGHDAVQRLDRWFRRMIQSPFQVVWLSAIVLPALYFQEGWTVGTPKGSLLPDVPVTALYGLFFGLGWALHRQPDLLGAFGRHWRLRLFLGFALLLGSRFGLLPLAYVAELEPYRDWFRFAHCMAYALMISSFVAGFLGLFLSLRQTESRVWRYLADSSYWVYLVHLPVIVALQIWVSDWPQSWMVKFPLVVAIATPLVFLSYHYLVRSTFIGRQLNGRKYPIRAG